MNGTGETEILRRKLEKLFPDAEMTAAAISVLESYGTEKHHREPVRVRLAVLKLAGDDLGKIRACVESAREDYRDVLARAEYPNQMRVRCELGSAVREKLIRRDREQYERWLFGGKNGD